jgi:hypothetical protein
VRALGVRSDQPLSRGTLSTFDAASATLYAAGPPGVLGEMPPIRVGYFDTRPWEGRPANVAENKDWMRNGIRQVNGDRLTLQLNSHLDSNFFGTSLRTLHDLFRFGAISVIVSSFDDPNDLPIGKVSGDPTLLANTTTNVTMRQAWIGPNVLPQLAGAGEASIDLLRWSGGGRFVAVWLWVYWVNVAAPPSVPIAYEVWDDREPRSVHLPISFPLRTVVDGPMPAAPTDLQLAFRWGQLPRATGYRLGVANGSTYDLEVVWRQFAGSAAFDDFVDIIPAGTELVLPVPGGGTAAILAGMAAYGYSHHFVYASNEANEADLGGPAILSLVARDTG